MSAESLEEHWAPARMVLAGRTLELGGHLVVAWDEAPDQDHAPTTGELRVDRAVPASSGVFVITEGGAVRYVGSAGHLARAFGPRGLGVATADLGMRASRREAARVHHLAVAATGAGRILDVYLLELGPAAPWWRPRAALVARGAARAAADELRAEVPGSWGVSG